MNERTSLSIFIDFNQVSSLKGNCKRDTQKTTTIVVIGGSGGGGGAAADDCKYSVDLWLFINTISTNTVAYGWYFDTPFPLLCKGRTIVVIFVDVDIERRINHLIVARLDGHFQSRYTKHNLLAIYSFKPSSTSR